MLKRKPKVLTPEQAEEIRTKDFFDMILPGTVKFLSDHYIVGDSYRCVWAIREYPPTTEEQAILSQLADRNGVTLRIYHRLVESMEQRKIIQNATRRNRLKSGGNDVSETIEAEGNLQDVIELLANLRKNKEPLLHCSVFIELKAKGMEKLKELQSDIAMELTRSKISVDRLTLRQKEGFLSAVPTGSNQFGAQYERVLPASSVANMYPFNFSGKTDPHGSYVGRDKYGTNILVDFDRRAEDKTTSNILILGNSGQGKSYLLKLILTNIRESGKRIICLDPETEYENLCKALGGCYMSNELLGKGSTAASVDELYLFLSNMTTIEYLRNCMTRVRKKDSSVILASQNIEDFLIPSIREFTKPLFSIPTHQFLFNAGQINPKEYMDALQVEPSEFELIKYPERGTCLYRCGNERYLLQVIAPEYKAVIFGKAGGR